jgi:hypothetical protein
MIGLYVIICKPRCREVCSSDADVRFPRIWDQYGSQDMAGVFNDPIVKLQLLLCTYLSYMMLERNSHDLGIEGVSHVVK